MIEIRDGTSTDINFIYGTMLNGLYYGCPFYNLIAKESFFEHYQVVIQGLLKRSISLKVACLADEPDVILGYSLYEPTVLHFIYVKTAWRKQGLAKRLTEGCSELSLVTHITELGNKLRLSRGWAFDPFKI